MVSMGGSKDGKSFSTELCGGTHVRRTGDIGFFKIVSEGALAAGVRRIEAVTGAGAENLIAERDRLLATAAAAINASPAELPARVATLAEEKRKLEREVSELRRQAAMGGGTGGAPTAKKVGNVSLIAKMVDGVAAKDLKPMVDAMKTQIGSGVVALVAVADGKASLVVGVTDDLTAKISAVELAKVGAEALGGKGGGGRPDMAQAGGPDGGNAEKALAAIEGAMGA